MYRRNATSNSRTKAGALSALAVAIGAILFSAAPAKADHFGFGFFFAPPFPIPVPVVVQHEVVYEEQPYVVYERPYYQPSYYGVQHRHHAGCHHRNDYGHGRGHGRDDWGRGDWDDDQGRRHHQRRNVGYRGRY